MVLPPNPYHAKMTTLKLMGERECDLNAVENLMDMAFGVERKSKTAYLLRQSGKHLRALSLIAVDNRAQLKGSLRFWPVRLENCPDVRTLLLGPLAIAPGYRGLGYARALIARGLADAEHLGWQLCLVITEESLYKKFGSTPAAPLKLNLPAYERPDKLHIKELEAGILDQRINGSAVLPFS